MGSSEFFCRAWINGAGFDGEHPTVDHYQVFAFELSNKRLTDWAEDTIGNWTGDEFLDYIPETNDTIPIDRTKHYEIVFRGRMLHSYDEMNQEHDSWAEPDEVLWRALDRAPSAEDEPVVFVCAACGSKAVNDACPSCKESHLLVPQKTLGEK